MTKILVGNFVSTLDAPDGSIVEVSGDVYFDPGTEHFSADLDDTDTDLDDKAACEAVIEAALNASLDGDLDDPNEGIWQERDYGIRKH